MVEREVQKLPPRLLVFLLKLPRKPIKNHRMHKRLSILLRRLPDFKAVH